MDTLIPHAANFTFWHPPYGHSVETGADSIQFPLPAIPLPVLTAALGAGVPSADAIGSSLYDYLRQFPDCPHNREYAALLRDAWPHYLADLGAMIVMLDHKEVDAPYIRRKIAGLQILLLLDPHNHGLLQQLGMACYELALNYVELCDCRFHLTKAMGYFSAAEKIVPNDPATLNYMAQIDYLFGDFPRATARWQTLTGLVQDEDTRLALAGRIEAINVQEPPEQPLLVDLESIGDAMRQLASGEPDAARTILERLEQQNVITVEFPNPEFYSLLAISRERCGDLSGAQAAFALALEIDQAHQTALDGMNRLLEGES